MMIKNILERNADVNLKDHDGHTALIHAAFHGYFAKDDVELFVRNIDECELNNITTLLTLLTDYRADMNIRNNKNETVVDMCKRFNHVKVTEFFETLTVPLSGYVLK